MAMVTRSETNRRYAELALAHLDSADPKLAWLFRPGKPPRQKALEQLGRIAARRGRAECRTAALELCTDPPANTHAGADRLRRRRLETTEPKQDAEPEEPEPRRGRYAESWSSAPVAEHFFKRLFATTSAYVRENPNMEPADIGYAAYRFNEEWDQILTFLHKP
jgi:hypothetical protein